MAPRSSRKHPFVGYILFCDYQNVRRVCCQNVFQVTFRSKVIQPGGFMDGITTLLTENERAVRFGFTASELTDTFSALIPSLHFPAAVGSTLSFHAWSPKTVVVGMMRLSDSDANYRILDMCQWAILYSSCAIWYDCLNLCICSRAPGMDLKSPSIAARSNESSVVLSNSQCAYR